MSSFFFYIISSGFFNYSWQLYVLSFQCHFIICSQWQIDPRALLSLFSFLRTSNRLSFTFLPIWSLLFVDIFSLPSVFFLSFFLNYPEQFALTFVLADERSVTLYFIHCSLLLIFNGFLKLTRAVQMYFRLLKNAKPLIDLILLVKQTFTLLYRLLCHYIKKCYVTFRKTLLN